MSADASSIRDLHTDEVRAGLADGTMTVVDVREPHELAGGVIPGSISMPLSRFDPSGLPTGTRIVFSCAAGVRSRMAVERSRESGLDVSEHYVGGFKGWVRDGEAVAPWRP